LFSSLFFLFTGSATARGKVHRPSDAARFEVNTDVLSILNGVIDGEREINLSGEMAFKRRFGILFHLATEKENHQWYTKESWNFTAEFRWYFECDCYSASHIGIFSGFMNTNTDSHPFYLQQTVSFFENGITGGYKLMISNSWSVDPSVSLFVSSRLQNQIPETFASTSDYGDTELLMRIMLIVGYRF